MTIRRALCKSDRDLTLTDMTVYFHCIYTETNFEDYFLFWMPSSYLTQFHRKKLYMSIIYYRLSYNEYNSVSIDICRYSLGIIFL